MNRVRSKRTSSKSTKTKKTETKTTVEQPTVSTKVDQEVVKPVGTADKIELIKKAMFDGEFSMGELAKTVDWQFQKVRRTCIQIAKQEGKLLKSVSRGRWVLESSS